MDDKKAFNEKRLMELARKVSQDEQFINLETFNDEMTISQVVRFFNRYGKNFTKTMIQNYVRVGVIPPPVDKRYYTKNHLILLTLVDNLKLIYSLDEIKTVFSPILKNSTSFEDDIIKVSDLYKDYIQLHTKALKDWKEYLPNTLEEVNKKLEEYSIGDNEKDTASVFMLVLTIMAETIALKKLIHLITEEYLNNNK
ncbi:MAG TPA: DUF1836 domain-containing protein [Defluviitaleaceae bacterium]|nr:DUF1836 domain-containing protein [Candidatus Epulonipiscium sp.]HOA80954.1 DUF1836 domain-containing protein [Defluviitaleaceae bacterium]